MELQTHLGEFNKRGLHLAAISYDAPQVLAAFAARRAITFPLLSDANSQVIRAFGIFNETIPATSSAHGVPHPGIYVLDPAGKVTAKYFEDNYAERVTASDILVRQFGAVPAPATAPAETQRLRLTHSTSAHTAVGGQKLALIREVTIPSDESLRTATNAQGIMTLEGGFHYQACDAKTCYPPESVPLQFQIQILRHDTQRVNLPPSPPPPPAHTTPPPRPPDL